MCCAIIQDTGDILSNQRNSVSLEWQSKHALFNIAFTSAGASISPVIGGFSKRGCIN
jgi:hypothetical protein